MELFFFLQYLVLICCKMELKMFIFLSLTFLIAYLISFLASGKDYRLGGVRQLKNRHEKNLEIVLQKNVIL